MMPLATYTELLASVATWLDRDDLGKVIPDLIPMAESRLNDRLRLAPMEKSVTLTGGEGVSVLTDETTGEVLTDEDTGEILTTEDSVAAIVGIVDLPDDFLEIRMLLADTSPQIMLQSASPGRATVQYGGFSSLPNVYTIVGNKLAIYPTFDVDLILTYYAKIPPLTVGAPTNWLLARYPQMYLYAALLEAAPVLYDDARASLWKEQLDVAISDAQKSDSGTRWSNVGLTIRGPTP